VLEIHGITLLLLLLLPTAATPRSAWANYADPAPGGRTGRHQSIMRLESSNLFVERVDSRRSRSTLCQSTANGAVHAVANRRSTTMRFLGYTLASETDLPDEPPSPELFEEMGKFVEEAVKAGVIVATGGIAPTSEGAIITLKDGDFTVVDGPFTEAKELVGGWALMECRDKAEAIEWSKRFVSVLGEGEVRIRPVSG
jgi:hypothetical protein